MGAASFFSTRDLSRPFSGGEWAGLTRGVAGSCGVKRDGRSARLSKQAGGKPLAFTCRSNKLGPHVQTQINIPMYAHAPLRPPTSHIRMHFSFTCHTLFSLCSLSYILHEWQREIHRVNSLKAHNQYYVRRFGNTVKGAQDRQKRAVFGFFAAFPSMNVSEQLNARLTSLDTSTTRSSLFSPSLS